MTPFLPYIFGVTYVLLGGYLFLTSFNLWRPKSYKEKKSKIPQDLIKVLSLIILASGFYDLFSGENNYVIEEPQIQQSEIIEAKPEPKKWSISQRNDMVEKCISSSLESQDDSLQIRKFCECSIDGLIANYSVEEFEIMQKFSQKEFEKVLKPIAENCK